MKEVTIDNKNLRDTNSQLNDQIAKLNDQLEILKIKQQELQQLLTQQKSSNELQVVRLEDKSKEIERISKQIQHAQANLEHYRETMRLQRDEERQIYESKISKLESKNDENTKIISALNFQLATCHKEIEQLNHQYNQYKIDYAKLESEKSKQTEFMQQLQLDFITLQKSNQELEASYHQKIKIIDDFTQKDLELKIHQAKLDEKVNHYQKALSQAEDKINQLHNERLFIAKEKSDLEYQVKLMKS